jgi:hypothetical protein
MEQVRVVHDYEKEYRILVISRPDEEQFKTGLRVILREGRKRQIREVGSLIGLPVVKIIRVRIGSLQLGNLKPREWRHLSSAEVSALKRPTEPKRLTAQKRPTTLKGQTRSKGRAGKAKTGSEKKGIKPNNS